MLHKIHIDLEISFSSKWHAGSGEGSFSIDRLVRRDSQNRPFLPASTLKGIIRQSCEKLSRTLGFPNPSDPHQVDLTNNQSFVPFTRMDSPIDHIFGTKFEQGELFFRDASSNRNPVYMSCNDTLNQETFARSRTARYRILKTTKEKHLFSTEYSPAESVLYTRIDGWHDNLVMSIEESYPPFAYCFLIAGILAVERIGGDKSTGSGWLGMPLRIKNIEYNNKSVNIDDIIELFELLTYKHYLERKGA